MKNKLTVYDKSLKLGLLLVLGIVFSVIIEKPGITSLFFYATFFVILYIFIVHIFNEPLDTTQLLAIGCVFVSLLGPISTMDSFSFSYFKKYIMFCCTVILLSLVPRWRVTDTTVKIILTINTIIALIYPFAYILGVHTTIAGGLTFNFTNPNLTGLFILHSLLYCVVGFLYFKGIWHRTGYFILFVILCLLLYGTKARACWVAVSAFAALALMNAISRNKVRFGKKLCFCIAVLPLVFCWAYLFLCQNGMINRFGFLQISAGKALTSRQDLWLESLASFYKNPIFGNYGLLGSGDGASQLHNIHLDTLVTYGTIPFVLYVVILYRSITSAALQAKSVVQKCALFAFFAIITQGCFEAALVSGGLAIYVLSCGFLFVARMKAEG